MLWPEILSTIIIFLIAIMSFILGAFKKKPSKKVRKILIWSVILLISIQLPYSIYKLANEWKLEHNKVESLIITVTFNVNATKVDSINSTIELRNLLSENLLPHEEYSKFMYAIKSERYKDSIKREILNDWQFRLRTIWEDIFVAENIENLDKFNLLSIGTNEARDSLEVSVVYNIPFRWSLSDLGCNIFRIGVITDSNKMDTQIRTFKVELLGPYIYKEKILMFSANNTYKERYGEMEHNIIQHLLLDRDRMDWETSYISLSDNECKLRK